MTNKKLVVVVGKVKYTRKISEIYSAMSIGELIRCALK